MATTPVPTGFHTITPYLMVPHATDFLEFLKQVFDATETLRTTGSAGGMHAEVRIGDSMLMVSDPWNGVAFPAALYLYVEDVDTVYQRALQAGATSISAPEDQPYGDRNAGIKDEFGNTWFIATHKEDVRL